MSKEFDEFMENIPKQNDVKGGELETFKNDVREDDVEKLAIDDLINDWEEVYKSRNEEIKEIIKELDNICDKRPFDYGMFEIRINNLRRLRVESQHINSFVTSAYYHKNRAVKLKWHE